MKTKWLSSTEYVHHETGEVINKQLIINKIYKIIKTEKETKFQTINNQQYGIVKTINICQESPYQSKFEF